jgi:exodeoxyribonuclease V alpha subunit
MAVSAARLSDLKAQLAPVAAKIKADAPAIAALCELPGIGRVLACRIVDCYGPDKAIEVVRDDPYRLTYDIDGIGFTTADTIAQHNGMPREADSRIEAGVVYAIDLFGKARGHCYASRAEMTHEATKVLCVDASMVAAAVERLVEANRVVVETLSTDGTSEAVYTWATHYAEEEVARMVVEILTTPARETTKPDSAQRSLSFAFRRKPLGEAVEQTIAGFATARGFALSDCQANAMRAIVASKVLVITGGPGTGKTTILRAIIDSLRVAGMRYEMAAPTGRAAKRMAESTQAGASTIHRLLGLKPGKRPKFDRQSPLPCDVVLVDECSMVDLQVMRKVLEATPPHARLILIGDVDQLPSISPGAVLRDVIQSDVIPTVRLDQVFRQAKGSRINVNAQRINRGEVPEGERGKGGEFYVFPGVAANDAADTVVDLVVRKLPAMFGMDPVNDVQVLCPAKKGADGIEALNARLRDMLNPPRDAATPTADLVFGFRTKDKVGHVEKNDYNNDVMNGDMGFVSAVKQCENHTGNAGRSKCFCKVTVKYDDLNGASREVDYGRDEIQYLKHAYALTIHRSQGGEFRAVIMPMLGPDIMLSRNLLYTGVTRGKGLVVLVSNDQAIRRALSETKREHRQTRLAERIRADHERRAA